MFVRKHAIASCYLAVLIAGCMPDRDNPLDPNGTNFRKLDSGTADSEGLPDQEIPDQFMPDLKAWLPDQCVPVCSPKLCGKPDSCGGTCKAGSGCYTPPGTWVSIPPAGFKMPASFQVGSPDGKGSLPKESCRTGYETLQKVTLTNRFEIQTTEVTQGHFKKVLGYNPSHFQNCGSSCPVEKVNWHEAAAYCNALSSKAGLTQCYSCTGLGTNASCKETNSTKGKGIYSCPGFRLPTEAEWEFAYRAMTTTAFYNGGIANCSGTDANASKIGWYCANSAVTYAGCDDGSGLSCGSKCMGPHPVGQKKPNAWGLYDMAGNVWEWCHDTGISRNTAPLTDPVGTYMSYISRSLRGGSWKNTAGALRAANCSFFGYTPMKVYDFGFRCTRTNNQ